MRTQVVGIQFQSADHSAGLFHVQAVETTARMGQWGQAPSA